MRVKHYPSSEYLMRWHLQANGHQVGIADSSILLGNTSAYAPQLSMMTVKMPQYQKLPTGEAKEVDHHLVGYGYYLEEAFVRLIGESIERYALVTSQDFAQDSFIKASYNDLKSKKNVLPWEYINIFSEADYTKFQKPGNQLQPLSKDDKISWLWCPSLFKPNERICIPVQFLYTSLSIQEPRFITSISKGTAAHRGAKRALQAAIIEAVEADAMMLRWYTDLKAPLIEVDDPIVQNLCKQITGTADLTALTMDLSMADTPGHVFNTILSAPEGKCPTILYGLGAGLEPKQTLYRTYIESLVIHRLARYGGLLVPEDYIDGGDRAFHSNFNTNVAYWANEHNAADKHAVIRDQHYGSVKLSELPDYSDGDQQTGKMLDQLSKISEYGVALDITPLELANSGWNVVRVFFPELVQMSLPSHPYSRHPRILQYGGVTNPHPHPLP